MGKENRKFFSRDEFHFFDHSPTTKVAIKTNCRVLGRSRLSLSSLLHPLSFWPFLGNPVPLYCGCTDVICHLVFWGKEGKLVFYKVKDMNLISSSAPRNSSLPAPIVLCISISSNYILPPLSKIEVILIAMEVSLQKVLVFLRKGGICVIVMLLRRSRVRHRWLQ